MRAWDSKKEGELFKKPKQSKSWEPVWWQPRGGQWTSQGEGLGVLPRQGQQTRPWDVGTETPAHNRAAAPVRLRNYLPA